MTTKRTPPLTEGRVRKGGLNTGVSQITDRPTPPAPMHPAPVFEKNQRPCCVMADPTTGQGDSRSFEEFDQERTPTMETPVIHRTYLCLGGPYNRGRFLPNKSSEREFSIPVYLNGEVKDFIYREKWLPTEEGVIAFWLADGLTLLEGFIQLAEGRK